MDNIASQVANLSLNESNDNEVSYQNVLIITIKVIVWIIEKKVVEFTYKLKRQCRISNLSKWKYKYKIPYFIIYIYLLSKYK